MFIDNEVKQSLRQLTVTAPFTQGSFFISVGQMEKLDFFSKLCYNEVKKMFIWEEK